MANNFTDEEKLSLLAMGDLLFFLRKESKKTLLQVQKETGLSHSAISLTERGMRNIRFLTYVKLIRSYLPKKESGGVTLPPLNL